MAPLDNLVDGCFKTCRNGRKLFFPWGWLGRGYIIFSDEDFERLYRGMWVWMKVIFPLMFLTLPAIERLTTHFTGSTLNGIILAAFSGLLFLTSFTVRVHVWCRDLKETDEKLMPPM